MAWARAGAWLLAMALAVGAAAPPAAAAGEHVKLTVTVSHLSKKPGKIDPRAAAIHERLRDEFRYESLRVLERRRLDLAVNDVASITLPTGRKVRLRPLHVGEGGALIAVDVEGVLQTDLRVPRGHPVDLGVDTYEDGKLVVTLER